MLETGKMYYLYNRGNNRENLFYKKENYFYFLRQFDKYLSNFLEVYAYCLLPNHFHFLIKVKEEDEILQHLASLKDLPSVDVENIPIIISDKFRLLFMSYAKAINKQENRVGSLFQKNFKIKEINNDIYFSSLVFYIHSNPQRHGLIDNYKSWNFSSYHSIISEKKSKLKKEHVIDWFGNIAAYKKFHNQPFGFSNLVALELDI